VSNPGLFHCLIAPTLDFQWEKRILINGLMNTISSSDYSSKFANKNPITSRPDSGTHFTTQLEATMNCPYPIKSLPVILATAFWLLCVPATVLAQTQLGADIDGEAAGDSSGEVSLSADGNRLAIGAGGNDGNGTDSGHVRVYEWSDMAWTQIGADIDGEAARDFSGAVSLSSDGNRLAIGAGSNDGNGDVSGHVRVYDLSMFNVFRINPGLNDA
jgi:hypothetical protein